MTLVYTSMEAAKRAFIKDEEAAIRDWTCFCRCGCRAPGVQPVDKVGFISPSLCKACAASGFPKHDVATPASYWNDLEDDAVVYAAAHPEPGFFRAVISAFMDGFRRGSGDFDE